MTVHVCIGSVKAGQEWFKQHGQDVVVSAGTEGLAVFPDVDVFIWAKRADLIILSHELIHAAVNILSGAGVTVSPKHDEALAYLHSHLLGQAREKIKRR